MAETVREVAAGVYLIPLSFPGALGSVNVYLIESDGERALVDAGWEFAGIGPVLSIVLYIYDTLASRSAVE